MSLPFHYLLESPKIPVTIPCGTEINIAVARNLNLLTHYLEITTVASNLGESVLTFNEDGIPHLEVAERSFADFVDYGIRAVFEARGWTYKMKAC